MSEFEPEGVAVPRSVDEKVQVTVYLPREVAEAARNAVVATGSYRRGYRSLSGLVADAIDEKVSRLAKQFNNRKPFPARENELRPGRPLSRPADSSSGS